MIVAIGFEAQAVKRCPLMVVELWLLELWEFLVAVRD
jgi:hypothetical protein